MRDLFICSTDKLMCNLLIMLLPVSNCFGLLFLDVYVDICSVLLALDTTLQPMVIRLLIAFGARMFADALCMHTQ